MDGALAKSEKVVKGRIDTPRQEHFYEETSLAIVVPVGEDDEYKIYYPTPAILFAQQMVSVPIKQNWVFNPNIYSKVSMFLGVPFNRVTVTSKRVRTI